MHDHTPLDLAIIGGGLAGLIHLHYARRAGLRALVLERESGVGGLWRRLPAWQDLQVSLADFVVGDMRLAGPMQPQVLAYVESCTGGHNEPVIPAVRQRDGSVREFHSSALRDPELLKGRDVIVVGGGASAFDLLDLCLAQGARRIAWVYRDARWFSPTKKPKAIAGTVRPFARLQAQGLSAVAQSAAIEADLAGRYAKFGIQAIQPRQALDVRHDQLIPGRGRMLADFDALERHPGATVESIEDGEVALADGTRLVADIVLWGTGYATDLSYFEDERAGGALDRVAHPRHGEARHGAAPAPQPSRDRQPHRGARSREPRRRVGRRVLPGARAAHPRRRALPDALTPGRRG